MGYLTPPPPPNSAALGASVAPSPSLTEPLHVTTAEAVKQFGETMMSALGALLSSHSQAVAHSLEARLADNASRMAAEVAGMVEAGMRKAVANMLAHELGGPIKPPEPGPRTDVSVAPPPPPIAHHNPVPPSKERASRLRVDIVGLTNGSDERLVAQAFGGGEVDLRFARPADWNGYQPNPNRHCIAMSERLPHAISNKLRKANIKPVYVKPTAGHIIHAIEELQRAHAAQVAH